jgi:hypothetical protein
MLGLAVVLASLYPGVTVLLAKVGAEIMGRGKFGPHHGPWPDQEWNGWWGEAPPFHTPVFVLTHHPRSAV